MNVESIIVWLIVGFAAYHIAKRLYRMAKGLASKSAGCATGCETCEYAPKDIAPPSPIAIDLSKLGSVM